MPVVERAPLTRDRIAEAALGLIDADGLDALTMRKLGQALGVEAMSLYNHVANKSDVLDAVGDALSGEVSRIYRESPEAESWRADATALAMAWWIVGIAHPHAFGLIADQVQDSPAAIQKMCDVYCVFNKTVLGTVDAADAFHAAASYVVGAVRQELTVLPALRAGEGFDLDGLPPGLEWIVDLQAVCVTTPGEEQFIRGLNVVLDGIAAQIERTNC